MRAHEEVDRILRNHHTEDDDGDIQYTVTVIHTLELSIRADSPEAAANIALREDDEQGEILLHNVEVKVCEAEDIREEDDDTQESA